MNDSPPPHKSTKPARAGSAAPDLVSEMAVLDSGEEAPDSNSVSSDAEDGDTQRDRSTIWALSVAALTMSLTMVPYLFGRSLLGINPRFGWYSWLSFNLDDSTVYMSWLRQAADGHFFQLNLFTTHPQSGHQFNLFFLALGTIARVFHLPIIGVWHGARVVIGIALLLAVFRLIQALVADRRAQRAAYLLVCFSAGLGWVPGLWAEQGFGAPVDVWQPEAITFLSLYLNPLNLFSLLLMVGIIGGLLSAERKKSIRPAIGAGLCGLLLGNIHTYDVITVAAVWAGYLTIRSFVRLKIDTASLARAVVAAVPTAISTGYTYHIIKTEDVFAKRAAVETLSASPGLVLLGYGLVAVLALFALRLLWRGQAFTLDIRDRVQGPDAAILLVWWAIANFSVSYIPLPFQRKMLMGEHLPVCFLGGIGLWWLLRGLRGRVWSLGLGAAVALLSVTNVRFCNRDLANFQANIAQSGIQRPFMYAGEVKSLEWIRDHAPSGVPIQPLPWIQLFVLEGKIGLLDTTVAAFAPGLTGHPVNAGHWGETPDFGGTMGLWRQFQLPNTPDQTRIDLLRLTGVRYLIFSQKHNETADSSAESAILSVFRNAPPRYLRLISEASNEDADVYEVIGPLR